MSDLSRMGCVCVSGGISRGDFYGFCLRRRKHTFHSPSSNEPRAHGAQSRLHGCITPAPPHLQPIATLSAPKPSLLTPHPSLAPVFGPTHPNPWIDPARSQVLDSLYSCPCRLALTFILLRFSFLLKKEMCWEGDVSAYVCV